MEPIQVLVTLKLEIDGVPVESLPPLTDAEPEPEKPAYLTAEAEAVFRRRYLYERDRLPSARRRRVSGAMARKAAASSV